MTLPELYNYVLGLLCGTCTCGFATADRCPQCLHTCCVLCADERDGLCPGCHTARVEEQKQADNMYYQQIVRQVQDEERVMSAFADKETIVSLPALSCTPRSLRAIAAQRRQQNQQRGRQAGAGAGPGPQTEPLHLRPQSLDTIRRLTAIKQVEAQKQRETH